MGERHFIDANVPMYAVGAPHPLKARCLAILEAAARDELDAVTDVEVLQEILHRYTALGQRERAVEVARLLLQAVPDVLPVTLEVMERALNLHPAYPALQARDIVHLAVIQEHDLHVIVTADASFDGSQGLTRLNPAAWAP